MEKTNGNTILLTTDGSEVSLGAIEPAVSLARALGADLTLLFVVPDVVRVAGGTGAHAPQMLSRGVSESEVEDAKRRLEKIRSRIGDDVEVRLAVQRGESVEAVITSFAAVHDVSFIAMASHGRSGLRRLLLGSTAEGVLRRSTTPVIIFPAS